MHPHQSALLERHASLERRLEQELARPRPDDLTVKQLKRAKLRIKDALASSWTRRRLRNRRHIAQNGTFSHA